jgi:hypothetical protein
LKKELAEKLVLLEEMELLYRLAMLRAELEEIKVPRFLVLLLILLLAQAEPVGLVVKVERVK